MKIHLQLFSLLFVTLMYIPLSRAAPTIDTFNIAQGPLAGAGTFNSVSDIGILGGERDVLLSSFPSTSSFSATTDMLNLSQTSGFTDVFVTYDGVDNSSALAMGLGGLNLLSTGTAFQLTLLSTASITPHAHLWLRAYTSASNYSEIHFVLDATNFPSAFNIPFNTMSAFGLGANFSNINAIQMELAIGSGISMDMHIDSISIVPEPSTYVLLLTGAVFVVFVHRRRGFVLPAGSHGFGRCGR